MPLLGLPVVGRVLLAACPVPYKILYKSPATLKGSAGSGWAATIDFLVAQSDMFTFCQFAAGTPVVYTTGTKIIPLSHPENNNLLCQGIEGVGTGSFTSGNHSWQRNWSHAKVSLTFNSVPFPTDGSTPFLTVETQGGDEVHTIAGQRLAFPDGSPIQADAGVHVPTLDYNMTIYQATALGDDVVAPLQGTVSNAPLVLGVYSWPTGCIRFNTMTARLTLTATFQAAYSRTLSFSCRGIPWNQFLKADGTWDTPTNPGGSTVYTPANLAPLLA